MATIFTDPDTKKPLTQHPKGNGVWGDAVTKFGPGLTGGHPFEKTPSNESGGTWAPVDASQVNATKGLVEFPCDHPGCTTVAKSKAGLGAHKRSHK